MEPVAGIGGSANQLTDNIEGADQVALSPQEQTEADDFQRVMEAMATGVVGFALGELIQIATEE